MSERDDGGPAFPVLRQHAFDREITGSAGGMSLRDYFAGQALVGLLAECAHPAAVGSWSQTTELSAKAYEYADAMLATRSRTGGEG